MLLKHYPYSIIIVMIFISCAGRVPQYLEPWQESYSGKFEDVRIKVIAHGLLAPNAHNRQSWRLVLDEQDSLKFSLFVDSDRLLPETDPYSRQILISQGTFLELVQIAASRINYLAEIELFPDGTYDEESLPESMNVKPLARVTLTKAENNDPSPLYPEIFKRVTNRSQYYGKPLTENEKQELFNVNTDTAISLLFFQDEESLARVRNLAIEGVTIEATTENTIMESQVVFRDSEAEKSEYRDGITLASGGLRGFKLRLIQFLSSTFPVSLEKFGAFWIKTETKNINSAPTFALLIATDNTRSTQVKVGMLYARFQLRASQMGISMHPLSQVLQEYPEMAEQYRAVHDEFAKSGQTIQMLVRMGRAKEVLHSPRRDVMDIIETGQGS